MADMSDDLSDDDIFFGKITLKEVKKHIWLNQGHSKTNNTRQTPNRNSFKIIETHSQPNLRSTSADTPPVPGSACDIRKSDETFIQMENLVSELCLSPEKAAELQLDNTLDIVDFILNNGPNQAPNQQDTINVKTERDMEIKSEKDDKMEAKCLESPLPKMNLKEEIVPEDIRHTTPKLKAKTPIKASLKYYTPMKSPNKQADIFLTPSSNMLQAKSPVFKTPTNPLSVKKPSVASLRNTPSKSFKYRHIESPIASYIKGSIAVPLVTNVCPKKPLPGGSLIPKPVKKENLSKQNKENINLPTSAYKSAKKTKVIPVPVEDKSKNHVAKKLLSTLPQPPVILKHETRQFNIAKKRLLHLQEDSIADVSCLQADLSVCTQVKPINK